MIVWKLLRELFAKIQSLKYRFNTEIGEDKITPFLELEKVLKDIVIACNSLSHLWSKENYLNEEKIEEKIEEKEKIIYCYNNEDEISKRIDIIVQNLEQICKMKTKNEN